MSYAQEHRILAIDTQLGADKVMLTGLEGEDVLSRPFSFQIAMATEESPEAVQDLLGTEVTLRFGRMQGEAESGPLGVERRIVHGIIRRLSRGDASRGDAVEWRAEVVPALWFLSCTTDCRIFQDKTIPDIVREILDLHGVRNYSFKLTGSYEKLDYCVQYRETALDFVSRLMEMVGIFFWHEHEEGRHTMVIADTNGATPLAPYPEIPITGRQGADSIRRFEEEFAVRSGKWTMRDYNFEAPGNNLEVSEPTTIKTEAMKRLERFDYPGLYMQNGAGKGLARLQIEQEEARFQLRRGESGIAGLDAGLRIKVAGIADPEVLVVGVQHRAEDHSHWTSENWGDMPVRPPSYENSFTCIPKRVNFRPQRETPRPVVQGPQTAVVTGPSGEEIYTDKYARVKVQFHWDRLGRKNEDSSCWVRVSQSWAGAGYGFIQIPRIGQEVIVDFLEGDPDRPIITGRVYNAEQMPPHGLPGAAVKSGLKTNSTKGGGGSNELTFDDTKGKEKVYFHAEYDLETVVEHDESQHVKNNLTITVDGTHTEKIKKDTSITVTEGKYSHTVATGTADITVKGKVTETFHDAQSTTVTKDITVTSNTSFVHVKAATDIVLEVGASRIALYADGRIEIKGKAVAISGSDAVNVSGMSIKEEAGNDHSISGAIVKSSGTVSNTVRGAMVMLNP